MAATAGLDAAIGDYVVFMRGALRSAGSDCRHARTGGANQRFGAGRNANAARSWLAVSLRSPAVLSTCRSAAACPDPGRLHRLSACCRAPSSTPSHARAPRAGTCVCWPARSDIRSRLYPYEPMGPPLVPRRRSLLDAVPGRPADSRVQLANAAASGQRPGHPGRLAQSLLRPLRAGDLLSSKKRSRRAG